jgi:hypothetical protein
MEIKLNRKEEQNFLGNTHIKMFSDVSEMNDFCRYEISSAVFYTCQYINNLIPSSSVVLVY